MGVGISFGMGAQLSHPDCLVVVLCGDLAFGLNAMELETAVRHNIPIIVVVAKNDDEQKMKEESAAKNSPSKVIAEPHEAKGTLQRKPKLWRQTITPKMSSGVTPLSFEQQRLWFLDQIDPKNPVYNSYRAWRLCGSLNREALRKAFETIVARHEVLRAVIQVVDGKACQVTNKEWAFQFPCIDLRTYSSQLLELTSKEITYQESKTPFDLSQGPLFRAKLLRLDDEDHVLLISMHHIISDGWSFGILHREIGTLYEAFENGDSSPSPELPLQFGDYALWQKEWFQGTRLDKLLSYWKPQLSNLTPLHLPTDHPRPSKSTYKGSRLGFTIGKGMTTKLKDLSQHERVTLFMTLVACFKILLYRYSGQEDIVVGIPIHNRKYREVEPLIGMFVNTLVLRSDLSGNPSFRELLQRVRDTSLGAYEHQALPFDKLVAELQPERDASRNPLFQVALVYQDTSDQPFELPGLTIDPFETSSVGPFQNGNDTSKFDLTLTLCEMDGEIQGMMEYSTDLFEAGTIRRMVNHFHTLLEKSIATRISLRLEFRNQLIKW